MRIAYSGENALDIVPWLNPDIVVLDIGLSGADGYEPLRVAKPERAIAGESGNST